VRFEGSYVNRREVLMWFTTAVPLRGLGLGMGIEGACVTDEENG
jgi:hypothetical protein